MEGDACHLPLQSVDNVGGKLAVAIEGFGDTLRRSANGPMVAALPEAHCGDGIVNASTGNDEKGQCDVRDWTDVVAIAGAF